MIWQALATVFAGAGLIQQVLGAGTTVIITITDCPVSTTYVTGGATPTTTPPNGPFLLYVLPQAAQQVQRRATPFPYVAANGTIASSPSSAARYRLNLNSQLTADGLFVSTDPTAFYQRFAGEFWLGPISTQFVFDANGTLLWRNDAFESRNARFCLAGNLLQVVFRGDLPEGCAAVSLGAIAASKVESSTSPINEPAATSSSMGAFISTTTLITSSTRVPTSTRPYVSSVAGSSGVVSSEQVSSNINTAVSSLSSLTTTSSPGAIIVPSSVAPSLTTTPSQASSSLNAPTLSLVSTSDIFSLATTAQTTFFAEPSDSPTSSLEAATTQIGSPSTTALVVPTSEQASSTVDVPTTSSDIPLIPTTTPSAIATTPSIELQPTTTPEIIFSPPPPTTPIESTTPIIIVDPPLTTPSASPTPDIPTTPAQEPTTPAAPTTPSIAPTPSPAPLPSTLCPSLNGAVLSPSSDTFNYEISCSSTLMGTILPDNSTIATNLKNCMSFCSLQNIALPYSCLGVTWYTAGSTANPDFGLPGDHRNCWLYGPPVSGVTCQAGSESARLVYAGYAGGAGAQCVPQGVDVGRIGYRGKRRSI